MSTEDIRYVFPWIDTADNNNINNNSRSNNKSSRFQKRSKWWRKNSSNIVYNMNIGLSSFHNVYNIKKKELETRFCYDFTSVSVWLRLFFLFFMQYFPVLTHSFLSQCSMLLVFVQTWYRYFTTCSVQYARARVHTYTHNSTCEFRNGFIIKTSIWDAQLFI